jgi:aminoglycoside phosphotransferase family enzyme
VISFRLDDPHIKAVDKQAAIKDASAYFKLALQYAKSL